MLFVIIAVKHVADNNQLMRFIQLQLRNQALHIFFKNGLRYWYAGFSKVAGFAQVKVAYNQCFLLFPKNTPVCRK